MAERRFLAFDIETAQDVPEDSGDWRIARPFGITCAAALSSDGTLTVWHAQTPEGGFAPRMSRSQVFEVVNALREAHQVGQTILTWNGLGFDFDVLAEESGMDAVCRELALNHVDMMFHFFCLQGYPLALDTAAKGMGLPGKPAGMSGAMAPGLWTRGEYGRVLEYLRQDVRTVLDLARAVEKGGKLNWISRAGRPTWASIGTWRTVSEALQLPEPDISWMSKPMSRKRFLQWTEVKSGGHNAS